MMLHHDEEIIIAQCTPQGIGAIALLRICGFNAAYFATTLAKLSLGRVLHEQQTHTIHFGWVVDDQGAHLDQVMFLLMKGPKTFSGQDTVEITCHNNPLLIEQIINRALQLGARKAEPGEFAKRAVLNGKIDLLQAEAIHDLITAPTQQAIKISLEQVQGTLSSWMRNLEQQILKIIAFTEASFEFLDEELTFEPEILQMMQNLCKQTDELLKTYDKQHYIKEGIKIALVGSVNVGKSSLFNAMLKKQRAIVTDIAGTTRDTIESGMIYEGNFITFVDTAGLRDTIDIVEKQGIDRSFSEAHVADILLVVFDVTKKLSQEEAAVYQDILQKYPEKTIVVFNKIDAQNHIYPDFISQQKSSIKVSAQTQENIVELQKIIIEKMNVLLGQGNISYVLNKRQYDILQTFYIKILKIYNRATVHIDYELLAMELRDCLELLAELTGKDAREAVLDAVFKGFCVGK